MRFNHHSPLDWLVVALLLAGIWIAISTGEMRKP